MSKNAIIYRFEKGECKGFEKSKLINV